MTMIEKQAAACLCLLALSACERPAAAPPALAVAGESLFAATPDQRWRLPDALAEISGMAATADGRIFAHDDERAILYELDPEGGRILKAFAVGSPALTDDFEGLAITPAGDFYMITSTGRIHRFREGEDGASVAYDWYNTGVRDVCEVEGLAYAPSRRGLILACKTGEAQRMRHAAAFFAWNPAAPNVDAERLMETPFRAFGAASVHPSALETDARTGRLIVLAARDGVLAELDETGAVLAVRRLDASHRQAEAATITPDGALLIGDEGAGARALLTRYPRQP